MYSPGSKSLTMSYFNGGLNITKPDTEILDCQAASCQNVMNDQLAGLDSRYGYSALYATSLGSQHVSSMFCYNTFATSTILFTVGSTLKKDLTSASTALFSGVAAMRGIEFDGNIYLLDGSGFLQYDGSAASAVSGYIPSYYINKHPDGTSGTKYDELNYIQSAFKETFDGNGSATSFYMTYGSLTTQTPTVLVEDVTQTLSAATAGFTINYASGIISLTSAAATGVGNVEITAYKPVLSADQITNCTFGIAYGLGIDTNLYLGGNSAYPARLFWSDTLDATYFPATSYADIGVTNDKLTGFIAHANSLLIWKYNSIYAWNGAPPDNSVTEIYQGEGCIATDSLRLVGAFPTCMSQRGVVQLKTEGLGYRLDLVSEDVNGMTNVRDGIMTETLANRKLAFGFVHDKNYFLLLNDTIWVLQYNLIHSENGQIVYPWIPWKTFSNAECFIVKDDYLYFGGEGNLYKFDPSVNTDNGSAINSFWLGKRFYPAKNMKSAFDYQHWHVKMSSSIATSTVSYTYYAGSASTSLSKTYTPNATTAFVDYFVRQPVHKKSSDIQYMIQENSTNGSFSLIDTEILYRPERRLSV